MNYLNEHTNYNHMSTIILKHDHGVIAVRTIEGRNLIFQYKKGNTTMSDIFTAIFEKIRYKHRGDTCSKNFRLAIGTTCWPDDFNHSNDVSNGASNDTSNDASYEEQTEFVDKLDCSDANGIKPNIRISLVKTDYNKKRTQYYRPIKIKKCKNSELCDNDVDFEHVLSLNNFHLNIHMLTGKNIIIHCESYDTVGYLKLQIQKKEGILPDDQRLIFAEKQLESYKTIDQYNIQTGNTLYLVLLLLGGMYSESSGRNGSYAPIYRDITYDMTTGTFIEMV